MFRQYTKCYQHTPGDKPFNESDLVLFVLGNSAPGVIAAILSFLNGSNVIGFLVIALQYAATIRAIAKEWLYHRLVCVSGDQCAIGKVDWTPEIGSMLGAFDNDQFFDIRLMPHRYNDLYGGPNTGFFAAPASSSDPYGTAPWAMNSPPAAGPSLDGLTEMHPANDVYLDGFQGAALICPKITDLLPELPPVARRCLFSVLSDAYWGLFSARWQEPLPPPRLARPLHSTRSRAT
jgi:hypothetical protein